VTYVGLGFGSINRIDEAGNKTSDFIKLPSNIITIRAHQDRLYILMYGQTYKIYVYDLNGQQITSWDHSDSNGDYFGNKLCVVRNQILVPDATNKRITNYNLNGKVMRQIPCPTIPTNDYLSMCSAGEDSVIITTPSPAQVFKFNMSTETVLWTTNLTDAPFSVASSNDVVLVSGEGHWGSKRGVWIEVLNTATGKNFTR
jgi:outer membrane protein assembly factor BamB